MGAPKALLRDRDGRSFVARVLHTLRAAGVADLTVVTGTLHTQIVNAVAMDAPRHTTIRFARNPDPAQGQLSSLVVGLDAADASGVDAALVTLVDVPFVASATVAAVMSTWMRSRAPIVRPVARASSAAAENGGKRERHGHPVLFARSTFDELRRADPARGAKAVVYAHANDLVQVPVNDEGAMLDLDTRDEYERALKS